MRFFTLKNAFTMFGNFSELVTQEPAIQYAFNDYKFESREEALPTGQKTKAHLLVKGPVVITIRVFRIDIEVFANPNSTQTEFSNITTQIANKLNSIATLKGVRIGFSCAEAVENINSEVVKACNSLFHVVDVYDEESKEFEIRLNHVKHFDNEDYNSIILLRDGELTNNQTKEKIPVMFINKDVNTVITNNTPRFDFSKVDEYLASMMIESNARTTIMLEKIKEHIARLS